jgi:hypothetical protein
MRGRAVHPAEPLCNSGILRPFRVGHNDCNAASMLCLLRARSEWPRGRAAEKRNEIASSHWLRLPEARDEAIVAVQTGPVKGWP